MKRQLTYSISITLLLIIAVVGSTYAFFSLSTNSNQNLLTNSSDFSVIYTGNSLIDGTITPSANKNGGLSTTINLRVAENSAEALASLYLNIEEMTSTLSTSGFKWEIYGQKNNQSVCNKSGTFNGYNDSTNKEIEIVHNCQITEDNTTFTLYLWIDGNNTGNEILGASFSGSISAVTENFTGTLPTNS